MATVWFPRRAAQKIINAQPQFQQAVAKVLDEVEHGALRTDVSSLQRALEKLGVDTKVTYALASAVEAQVMLRRWDPHGEIRRSGLPETELVRLARRIDRHADQATAERLTQVAADPVLCGELRRDVALLEQGGRTDLSVGERSAIQQKAAQAGARLDALGLMLSVTRDDLAAAVRQTLVDPQKADALIAKTFASFLPEGARDRTSKGVRLVGEEEFARAYRGFNVFKSLPYWMPHLVKGGQTLVPLTDRAFGSGATVVAGLRQYASAKLVDALGGDEGAKLLGQGLAEHLAGWVNEQYSKEDSDKKLGEGKALGIKGRPASDWVAVDLPTPRALLWKYLGQAVGWEGLARGFFQDPVALKRDLVTLVGETGFEQIKQTCLLEEQGRLSLSAFQDLVKKLIAAGSERQASLAGVSADNTGATAGDRQAIALAVRSALGESPAKGATALRAALEIAEPQSRRPLAHTLAEALGADGLKLLPRQALARLGSDLVGSPVFATLASEAPLSWTAMAPPPASGVPAFDEAFAHHQREALARVVAQANESTSKWPADELAGVNAQIQAALEPLVPSKRLASVLALTSRPLTAKDDADLVWASLLSPGTQASTFDDNPLHLPLRPFLVSEDANPRLILRGSAVADGTVEVALALLRHPKVGKQLPLDLVAALEGRLASGLDSITPPGVEQRGYLGSRGSIVVEQVAYALATALEQAAGQAQPGLSAKERGKVVHEQLAKTLLQGDLSLLAKAVDGRAGPGTFDELRARLKTVSRDYHGLEALRPLLKRI